MYIRKTFNDYNLGYNKHKTLDYSMYGKNLNRYTEVSKKQYFTWILIMCNLHKSCVIFLTQITRSICIELALYQYNTDNQIRWIRWINADLNNETKQETIAHRTNKIPRW